MDISSGHPLNSSTASISIGEWTKSRFRLNIPCWGNQSSAEVREGWKLDEICKEQRNFKVINTELLENETETQQLN